MKSLVIRHFLSQLFIGTKNLSVYMKKQNSPIRHQDLSDLKKKKKNLGGKISFDSYIKSCNSKERLKLIIRTNTYFGI